MSYRYNPFVASLLLLISVSLGTTPTSAFRPRSPFQFTTLPPRPSEQKTEPITPQRGVVVIARNERSSANEAMKGGDGGGGGGPLYRYLSTPRDQKPGRGNFLYNDEVISHLHGYMYLVGLFVAKDEMFLAFFLAFASIAAAATQVGRRLLPANSRVPAVVAAVTLMATLICRYGIGHEFMFLADQLDYSGPADGAIYWEALICALNMAWGFGGTWRTKEQVNGATYGF